MPHKNIPTPSVRLAVDASSGSGKRAEAALAKTKRYPMALSKPDIRLAHVPGAQGDNNLMGRNGVKQLEAEDRPGLLISFYYLEAFLRNQEKYAYRDWVMDSGAFSAYNSGKEINLQDYIDCCKSLKDIDDTLTEIYALDVIGDWRQTIKNTEEMWKQGVEAIPCYHLSDKNWDILISIAKDYPKIAVGGVADLRGAEKERFIEQCFARVWPKKIHGFGCGGEKLVMAFPWHSVDATNWEMGPCAFGRWNAFGGKLSVRGSSQNLRSEVLWYLELERKARDRWKNEMQILEEMDSPPSRPDVRLCAARDGGGQTRLDDALRKQD